MSIGGLLSLNVWAGTTTFLGSLLVEELEEELELVDELDSEVEFEESSELVELLLFALQPKTRSDSEAKINIFLIFICLIITFF